MKKGPYKMKAGKEGPMKKNFEKKLIKKVGHYASGLVSGATAAVHAPGAALSSLTGNDNSKVSNKHKEIRKHSSDHFKKGNKIKLFKKNK